MWFAAVGLLTAWLAASGLLLSSVNEVDLQD
jgi:hypothetical protein